MRPLGRLTFGAAQTPAPGQRGNPYRAFFNGRLEDPAVLAGAHDGAQPIEPDKPECLAWWDFSAEIPTDRIIDRGPHGLHGHLRNLPTRAMRGSRWTGEEAHWRYRPRHYAAIHFHQDDLYDCGWETDFVFEIPAGMASGVYGIRLRCNDIEDIVPVYVLPPAGAAAAPIVFLASTFTYQIYGNHQRSSVDSAFRARQAEWHAYPWNADQHPESASHNIRLRRFPNEPTAMDTENERRRTNDPGCVIICDPHPAGTHDVRSRLKLPEAAPDAARRRYPEIRRRCARTVAAFG